MNRMGLFFPVLRVEQAHFSILNMWLTAWVNYCIFLIYKSIKSAKFDAHFFSKASKNSMKL